MSVKVALRSGLPSKRFGKSICLLLATYPIKAVGSSTYKYALTVVDEASRYKEAQAATDKTATKVAKALEFEPAHEERGVTSFFQNLFFSNFLIVLLFPKPSKANRIKNSISLLSNGCTKSPCFPVHMHGQTN